MHDRRIGDGVITLGNQGALFMRAMTWWDHETGSIWSQPWGAAIEGELAGTRLALIPVGIEPLQSWVDRHPNTKVLVVEDDRRSGLFEPRGGIDFFVIGVTLGDDASAYWYGDVAEVGVVNDRVGDQPIAVFVASDTREINVYFSSPSGGATPPGQGPLTFSPSGDGFVDDQTGSVWDQFTGEATSGPLSGSRLTRLAYVSSFDWAWEDFFPQSRLYEPPNRRSE